MTKYFLLTICVLALFSSCKEDDKPQTQNCDYQIINNNDEVIGYNILAKVPGIWNGKVSSSTPLGGFPEWIVDFRPISPSNVAAKNELDKQNDIFMSFFIVKHDCKNKVAFRNGGSFAGLTRNTYMLIDSVFENNTISYYRFSDPVSEGERVYSDITFKGDSFILDVYTNKYNTLNQAVSHMTWRAKLADASTAQAAIDLFNFPQKQLTKDFSNTFDGLSEAVFYDSAQDPYPEEDQPYLGQSTVNVNISNPSNPDNLKKVLIILTSEPLFNGLVFNVGNLKYRSRYVFVSAETNASYTFNYMHPGTYYVNTIYDENNDLNFSSGDYMNSDLDKEFVLGSEGNTNINISIDFQIP